MVAFGAHRLLVALLVTENLRKGVGCAVGGIGLGGKGAGHRA